MEVKIRLAEPADAPAVAEVHITSRTAYYAGQVDVEALDRRAAQLRMFYRDNTERFDRRLGCAERDGAVVGMTLTGPPRDYLLPWVGQLYQIHVHPDHRHEVRTPAQNYPLTVPTFPGADGQTLTYQEVGEGRPLVLLHGFLITGTHWLDVGKASTLADAGHRVILPDLRGHGESAAPQDKCPLPPDILADDGLALIKHLDLVDYDLGGYSLGARIVVRMLAKGAHPAKAVVAGQGLAQVTGTREGRNRRVLTAMTQGTPVDPADENLAGWIRASGNDPLALLNVLNTVVPTPEPTLRKIRTPTLVVVGTDDEAQSTADALAAALPNAQFATVPGNHFTAMGNVAEVMKPFLA